MLGLGPSFEHFSDAIEAGYSRVNRSQDKDTSGPNSFGYSYENKNGEKTVDVWFSKEKRRTGYLGCVIPMYPPN